MNYYKKNLAKLGTVKMQDSIQIKFEGKQTNYFAINKDSIQVLKDWIDNIEIK